MHQEKKLDLIIEKLLVNPESIFWDTKQLIGVDEVSKKTKESRAQRSLAMKERGKKVVALGSIRAMKGVLNVTVFGVFF